MPARLEVQDVTCPASTPSTAPVEAVLNWDGGIVRRIHIVIPAGHSGLTGIGLGFGHQKTIPYSAGQFIEGDDDVIHFDYIDNTPGGRWSAFMYNTDLQAHTWQVRFELDEISGAARPAVVTPIAPSDITDTGDALLSGA